MLSVKYRRGGGGKKARDPLYVSVLPRCSLRESRLQVVLFSFSVTGNTYILKIKETVEYLLASTLSNAFVTPSSASKKSSLYVSSTVKENLR